MIHQNYLSTSLFLLCSLLVISCASYDLGSEAPINIEITSPTWNGGISELIRIKCASCHTSDRGPFVPANTPSSFDQLADGTFFFNNRVGIENRVFISTTFPMPPEFATPLTDTESTALQTYLDSL